MIDTQNTLCVRQMRCLKIMITVVIQPVITDILCVRQMRSLKIMITAVIQSSLISRIYCVYVKCVVV